MQADRDRVVDRLRRRLLGDAGSLGWGYYAGRAPRIEPTCWALLALGAAWDPQAGSWADFARPRLAFLATQQRTDGLLADTDAPLANLASNGLAAVALASWADQVPMSLRTRLYDALVAVKGVSIGEPDPRQDNSLQGWPWVADTFSWVEPTAWCLLALKTSGAARHRDASLAREAEAERLLVNRICVGGGWNYGNASTLGQDLRPYVPTTAVALLAMQDRRNVEGVAGSLQVLSRDRLTEPASMSLALTTIALRVYDLPTDDLAEPIMASAERSEELGRLHAIAMALYALSADRHQMEAFRVRT